MTIIDHLSLGVADVPAARVFYGRVLDIFGIRCLAEGDRFAAFGRDRIAFLLLAPLDDRGILPARDAEPVVPDYEVPSCDVAEARQNLDAVIETFCADVLAWHADRTGDRPRLGIRATVGLGKSRTARIHLLRLAGQMKVRGLPGRLVIFTATHALAEEAAEAWRADGADVAVLRGYERQDPQTGQPMCLDLAAVRAAHTAGLRAHTAVCAGRSGERCGHFEGCLKQENRRQVAAADVVVAPYDALFSGFAFESDDIALLMVDEACWPRALDTSRSISVEDFREEMLGGMGSGSIGRGPVGAMADLAAFRQRVARALSANGPGPVRSRALLAAGLTAQDCADAAQLERWRKKDPCLQPGLSGAARNEAFRRNAAFLLTLRDAGVRFIACDMPQANDLTVGIMALVAEQEREAISHRTKEALVAAKARGIRLGNPNGAAALRRSDDNGRSLRAAVTANADTFARSLAPVLADIRAQGHTSLRAMAAELNARGIRTRRGGKWQVSNVRNLVVRIEKP